MPSPKFRGLSSQPPEVIEPSALLRGEVQTLKDSTQQSAWFYHLWGLRTKPPELFHRLFGQFLKIYLREIDVIGDTPIVKIKKYLGMMNFSDKYF